VSAFLLLSVLMLLGAVLAVVVPLVHAQTKSDADPKDRSFNLGGALSAVIVVPAIALGLYAKLTSWEWDSDSESPHAASSTDTGARPSASASGSSMPSVEELLPGLRERLEREPNDLNGWRILGRSYATLNRYAESIQAYKRAYELTGGQDADVLAEYAEAMILADRTSLMGEAGDLVEQALSLNSDNPKALYFGGMKAYFSEDKVTARARLSRVLAMSPPEGIAQTIENLIAEIDGAGVSSPVTASVDEPAAGIRLSLSVAPELASRLSASSPLFVFARQAGVSSGPPLAVVRRQAGELPLTMQLTDRDAMLPGTKLSSFESLQFVARVSFGGTPQAQSGDLFGERQYSSIEGGDISLVIDKVVP